MVAEIDAFQEVYMDRISQLTNKTNQFNLTTRRFQRGEMDAFAADDATITLYGKLKDKFGDNGLVSVIAGRIEDETLHVFLWLMSCRVLKRGMEYAMADVLIERARARGVKIILGEYRKSDKNQMVELHYESLGFRCTETRNDGATWVLEIDDALAPLNHNIKVIPYGS